MQYSYKYSQQPTNAHKTTKIMHNIYQRHLKEIHFIKVISNQKLFPSTLKNQTINKSILLFAISATGFRLSIMPSKITHGTGAPCRVMAFLDSN